MATALHISTKRRSLEQRISQDVPLIAERLCPHFFHKLILPRRFGKIYMLKNNQTVVTDQRALIAQLDRAPDYESVGRRFESCWARQKTQGVWTDLSRSPKSLFRIQARPGKT